MTLTTKLTSREADVLMAVYDGLTNAAIGARLGTTAGSVSGACSSIRNKGYDVPKRQGTPRRKAIPRCAKDVPGRYTAEGVKPSTGERFTVTADSQAFASAHLAAMVGARDV